MVDDKKREKIQNYFKGFPSWTIILLFLGVSALIAGIILSNEKNMNLSKDFSIIAFIFGILFMIISIIAMVIYYSGMPSDEQVDDWLEEDRESLLKRAQGKLGIDASAIIGETYEFFLWLWTGAIGTKGIPSEDIKEKLGKIPCKYHHLFYSLIRHSAWRFLIFLPTEHFFGCYECSFDFLRGKHVNEKTLEIYYKDITILSTETEDNIDGSNGLKITESEIFSLTVSSGETIAVSIRPDQYFTQSREVNISETPSTKCEKIVHSMRKMIHAKKI